MLLAQKKKREYNCTVRAMTRKKEARGDFSFFLSYFRIVLAYVAKSPKKEKYLRFVTFIVMISTVNLSLSSVHCTLYALIRREVIFWSFFLARDPFEGKRWKRKERWINKPPFVFCRINSENFFEKRVMNLRGAFWQMKANGHNKPFSFFFFPFHVNSWQRGRECVILRQEMEKKRS